MISYIPQNLDYSSGHHMDWGANFYQMKNLYNILHPWKWHKHEKPQYVLPFSPWPRLWSWGMSRLGNEDRNIHHQRLPSPPREKKKMSIKERKSTYLMIYLTSNNPQISFGNCISFFLIFYKSCNIFFISPMSLKKNLYYNL